MSLATYIQDLLYRYDCVIVPDFGGFVTNKIGAVFNEDEVHPPAKQLGFNSHLTHNDGLLTNYVATSRNLSFEEANHYIAVVVAKWNQLVKSEALILDQIGSFTLNEAKHLVFEPTASENYLLSSFGLASVASSQVARKEQKVIPIQTLTKEKSSIPTFVKYAASVAIALTLGYGSWNGYQNNLLEQNFAKEKKKLDTKIQTATFVINNPLPTIELNVSKEVAKPYHVIAGSFRNVLNAERKIAALKSNGFKNAVILGKNKWGLTQVAYESFSSKTDAYKTLASVRKTDSNDAWLLIKRFH